MINKEDTKENKWTAIPCTRFCDGGYRGMDNCNACGCTGAMLIFITDQKTYPNNRDGWLKMLAEHPGEIEDKQ